MSRSYKRPWIKDPSNSPMKKVAARVYRRSTRQITETFRKGWEWGQDFDVEDDTPDAFLQDPEYPHRYALVDPYTVCDFITPALKYVNKRTGLVPK